MRRVIMNIDQTGQIEVEAEGFEGRSCLDATQPFEEVLGIRSGQKRKREFYRGETSRHINKQKCGRENRLS